MDCGTCHHQMANGDCHEGLDSRDCKIYRKAICLDCKNTDCPLRGAGTWVRSCVGWRKHTAKDILQRCKDAFPDLGILDAFMSARNSGLLTHDESDYIIKGMPSWINTPFADRADEWEHDFSEM